MEEDDDVHARCFCIFATYFYVSVTGDLFTTYVDREKKGRKHNCFHITLATFKVCIIQETNIMCERRSNTSHLYNHLTELLELAALLQPCRNQMMRLYHSKLRTMIAKQNHHLVTPEMLILPAS